MPYKTRRRRRYGRKPRYTTYGSVKFLAKKAYEGVKYIKGLINVERKMFDSSGTVAPDSSGNVAHVSAVQAGNDVNNRSGNSILCKAVLIRLTGTIHGSATNTQIRGILVQDLQNQGTAPAITDVLQASTPISPLNVDTTARWRILRDQVISLSANGRSSFNWQCYARVNDHIKYTGTGNNPYTNQIYFMLLSDQGAGTPPTVQQYTRMYFYDN